RLVDWVTSGAGLWRHTAVNPSRQRSAVASTSATRPTPKSNRMNDAPSGMRATAATPARPPTSERDAVHVIQRVKGGPKSASIAKAPTSIAERGPKTTAANNSGSTDTETCVLGEMKTLCLSATRAITQRIANTTVLPSRVDPASTTAVMSSRAAATRTPAKAFVARETEISGLCVAVDAKLLNCLESPPKGV